jgi:hypothetical protein
MRATTISFENELQDFGRPEERRKTYRLHKLCHFKKMEIISVGERNMSQN